jgi:hypothetical protein
MRAIDALDVKIMNVLFCCFAQFETRKSWARPPARQRILEACPCNCKRGGAFRRPERFIYRNPTEILFGKGINGEVAARILGARA